MVRKGELVNATWDEVDFKNKVWTIPAERMKAKRAHNVYLSEQALDFNYCISNFIRKAHRIFCQVGLIADSQ